MKNNVRRALLVACSALLLVAMTVAGTIAWLTDSTDEIVNTFTTSGIDITLTETNTGVEGATDCANKKYKLVPGMTYAKNPIVKVEEPTDVPVYLFVKMTGSFPSVLTVTNNLTAENGGWTAVDGETGVYYRVVNPEDTTKEFHLIEGDKVQILGTVTKDQITAASATTVAYKAFAIQTEGFATAKLAWAEVSKLDTTNP